MRIGLHEMKGKLIKIELNALIGSEKVKLFLRLF